MATTDTPWMTTDEVAEYVKVPTDTVRSWRYRGVGPAGHRTGRHVRYHRDDVDEWMRSDAQIRRTGGAPSAA
jgi:excisionase family DNA binding protein